jgi:putative SOS response-associated peptidase YedK
MAGLWDRWESPDKSPIDTCTILTTEANEFVRPIHDRMPVIVRASDYGAWLGPATGREDLLRLKNICRPYPAHLLTGHPVGRMVNSPRHDDPQCVQPVMAEEGLF